jgi:hypothetical protein
MRTFLSDCLILNDLFWRMFLDTCPEEKNSYATPALEKGLDVIELLARQPRGLTRNEISRELNRTVSEIFRMLLCLEQRGYIAQVDGDRYALTPKLFNLVQLHPPTEQLITEALPVMHQVAYNTRQSCHMGVIEGAEVIILAQVNAPISIGFCVRLGSSVELLEATTGHVILAHQDEERRARTLAEWRRLTGSEVPPGEAAGIRIATQLPGPWCDQHQLSDLRRTRIRSRSTGSALYPSSRRGCECIGGECN